MKTLLDREMDTEDFVPKEIKITRIEVKEREATIEGKTVEGFTVVTKIYDRRTIPATKTTMKGTAEQVQQFNKHHVAVDGELCCMTNCFELRAIDNQRCDFCLAKSKLQRATL